LYDCAIFFLIYVSTRERKKSRATRRRRNTWDPEHDTLNRIDGLLFFDVCTFFGFSTSLCRLCSLSLVRALAFLLELA